MRRHINLSAPTHCEGNIVNKFTNIFNFKNKKKSI